MSETWAVIMAGGSGTRFWPVGRRSVPKQLLEIRPGRSLVQETVARIPARIGAERTIVVTRADQAEALAAQVALPPENLVAEPEGRDTAACVALAAAIVERRSPGAVTAVMAADHVIEPVAAFDAALLRAEEAARTRGALVAFGVEPRFAATGYGYLELGAELSEDLHEVAAFREKPDRETAERFLASGRHVWNAGIFVWRAADVLEEIGRHLPALRAGIAELEPLVDGPGFSERLAEVYPGLQRISIDFGIMERSDRVLCVRARFDWDDVGSLLALERHNPRDEAGCTALGDVLLIDAAESIADNRAPGLLALLDVEDLIVVRTGDAVLVARRRSAERVREIVKRLEDAGRDELL